MKHIFKRELAAFLAAAAVLGGILAGATHYLTPQQHDYGSVWGMYDRSRRIRSMCCSSARPSPTAMWYLPCTGKIPVDLPLCRPDPEQPLPLTLVT